MAKLNFLCYFIHVGRPEDGAFTRTVESRSRWSIGRDLKPVEEAEGIECVAAQWIDDPCPDGNWTMEQQCAFLEHRWLGFDTEETPEHVAAAALAGKIVAQCWRLADGDPDAAFRAATPILWAVAQSGEPLQGKVTGVALDFLYDALCAVTDVMNEDPEDAAREDKVLPWITPRKPAPDIAYFHGGPDGDYGPYSRARWLDDVGTGRTTLDYWDAVEEFRQTLGKDQWESDEETYGRL